MENGLSKNEIEYLLSLEKNYVESQKFIFPSLGGKITVPLISDDKSEDFILDISRSRVDIIKNTFQNRVRKTIILLRLDINSSPHRNPDG